MGLASTLATIPEQSLTSITVANRALAGGFRGRLDTVKGRFDKSSAIDIRGCRLGQNPDYMRAVQCYFGRSGNLPDVTAPEWFQSFPSFGFQSFAGEADTDAAATSGVANRNLTATDVSDALQLWAGLTGAAAQFAFWAQLFGGDPVTVVSLSWRSSIPALQMESEIDSVSTAGLGDAIRTLQRAFNIPATALPNPADLAMLAQKQPVASALASSMQALQALQGSATPVPAQLQALQRQLAQLQQQISPATPATTGTTTTPATPGGGGGGSSTPSGSATAPTAAQLQAQAQTLSQTLAGQLAPINPFLQALATKVAAPTGLLRFYLNLGFVLPAQSAATPDDISLLVLDRLRNTAITRWLRKQWQGTVPANAAVLQPPIDIVNVMTKRYAALSDAHQATQVVFTPTSAYMSHIVRVSGGNFICNPQGSNAPVATRGNPSAPATIGSGAATGGP
jgi:hypothetical protein